MVQRRLNPFLLHSQTGYYYRLTTRRRSPQRTWTWSIVVIESLRSRSLCSHQCCSCCQTGRRTSRSTAGTNQALKEKWCGYNEKDATHDPQQELSNNATVKFVSKRKRAQSEKTLQDIDPIKIEGIPPKNYHKVEGNSTMHDNIVSSSASLPSHLSASELLDIKKTA